MNIHTPRAEEVRAIRSDRIRVSDLLARYPRVSDQETREIVSFLRTGRHLDIGLLTSNDQLRPKLDAFMDEHRAHFQLKWREGATLIGGIVAILAVLWLVWESFG